MTAGPSGVLSGLCLSTLGDFLPTPGALLLTPQNQTKLGKAGACSRGLLQSEAAGCSGEGGLGAEQWLGHRKRKECAEVAGSKCAIRSHARTCQRGGVVGFFVRSWMQGHSEASRGPLAWRSPGKALCPHRITGLLGPSLSALQVSKGNRPPGPPPGAGSQLRCLS